MPLSPELIAAVSATAGAIGLISLLAYFFTYQKVRELSASERSVKNIVQGEGLFQPEQVIHILKQFSTDTARLEALKQLAAIQRVSEEKADRVYAVIRKNVDISTFQNERYRHIQSLTRKTGPFFIALALLATGFDIYRSHQPAGRTSTQFLVSIHATVTGEYKTRASQDFPFHHQDSDGDCGVSRPSDKTWCLPAGWRVVQATINRISANCNSNISDPTASGESCVFVSSRLAGCGYDNLMVARNCKGRGFLEYNLNIKGDHEVVSPIPPKTFTVQPAVGQTEFVFRYEGADKFPSAEWRYEADVSIERGENPVLIAHVSNSQPSRRAVSSRIENGVLSIELDPAELQKP